MFCRKCGKPVPDGQEYCDECRKLDIVTGEVSDNGSNSAMQGFVPALIAAIIAVTLMALVPVVAWLMSGGFSVPRILKSPNSTHAHFPEGKRCLPHIRQHSEMRPDRK